MYEKPRITHPALSSWVALNQALKGADERLCKQLLAKERTGRGRRQFLKRIHARLNKARADREREELLG